MFKQFTSVKVSKTPTYSTHKFCYCNGKLQNRSIGSSRLAVSTPHLHEEFNFTESMLETVRQSLHHSCPLIRCQGISLPQDRQVTAAVYQISVRSQNFPAYDQHWAGFSHYTSSCSQHDQCFTKQLLSSILYDFKNLTKKLFKLQVPLYGFSNA